MGWPRPELRQWRTPYMLPPWKMLLLLLLLFLLLLLTSRSWKAKRRGWEDGRSKIRSPVHSTSFMSGVLGEGPWFLYHRSNTRRWKVPILECLPVFLCNFRNSAWIIKLYVCCRKIQIFYVSIFGTIDTNEAYQMFRNMFSHEVLLVWSSTKYIQAGSELRLPRLETLIAPI